MRALEALHPMKQQLWYSLYEDQPQQVQILALAQSHPKVYKGANDAKHLAKRKQSNYNVESG